MWITGITKNSKLETLQRAKVCIGPKLAEIKNLNKVQRVQVAAQDAVGEGVTDRTCAIIRTSAIVETDKGCRGCRPMLAERLHASGFEMGL